MCLVSQSCLTVCNPTDCSPPGSSIHGDSPGESTGVGCHTLLQGIFPTQTLNPSLTHCRCILYHVCHQGNPCFSQVFTFSVLDLAHPCMKCSLDISNFLERSLLLLLLWSHFSRVRLFATPSTAAHHGSPIPGILQARTLESVAISFSNAWKWKWSCSVVSNS